MSDDYEMAMTDEEMLKHGIELIVDGFGHWLRKTIASGVTETQMSGYEFRMKDDKHQVVFAYRKNDDSQWWNEHNEDVEKVLKIMKKYEIDSIEKLDLMLMQQRVW